MSNLSQKLAVGKLEKLRRDRQDPILVINQSIFRGWSGLFPVKDRDNPQHPPPSSQRRPTYSENPNSHGEYGRQKTSKRSSTNSLIENLAAQAVISLKSKLARNAWLWRFRLVLRRLNRIKFPIWTRRSKKFRDLTKTRFTVAPMFSNTNGALIRTEIWRKLGARKLTLRLGQYPLNFGMQFYAQQAQGISFFT